MITAKTKPQNLNLAREFSKPRRDSDVKNKVINEPNIDDILKSFHSERENFKTDFSVKSVEHSKNNSLLDRFMKDANFRSASISGLNALLHSMTVATSFTPGLKKINEFIDKAAFFCTKIVSPYISFGISSFFSFKDKKPIEALIKAIPPLFLPFIGDANVDTVFGLCFGLNQPYDVISGRIKAKSTDSQDFAKNLEEKNKTSLGNSQVIWDETKSLFKDFFKGKLPWRDAGYVINCSMILAGSLPMLLFASQQRNTAMAKFFGILRNCGGIMGDALFLSQKASFHKLLVGILCSLGAVSNITKRLVPNEALARVFIHLGAALDVAGYTVWNAWSDKKEAAVAAA